MKKYLSIKEAKRTKGFVRCERYRLSYAKYASVKFEVKKLKMEKEVMEVMKARFKSRLDWCGSVRAVWKLNRILMELDKDIEKKDLEIDASTVNKSELKVKAKRDARNIRKHKELVVITEADFDASKRAKFDGKLQVVKSCVRDNPELRLKLAAKGNFSYLKRGHGDGE